MTYQHERDEFISLATQEGLGLDTCRKLLRYATTLHRLAEAQCNGDWPYNGDRDRPSAIKVEMPCTWCGAGNEPKTPACECDERGIKVSWKRDEKADERAKVAWRKAGKPKVKLLSYGKD